MPTHWTTHVHRNRVGGAAVLSAILLVFRGQKGIDVDVGFLGFMKLRQQRAGPHFGALQVDLHPGFQKHQLAAGTCREAIGIGKENPTFTGMI